MTEWLKEIDDLPPKDMAPSTRRMYHNQANKVLSSAIARINLGRLDFEDYGALFAGASGRNSSKKIMKQTVKTFLMWCRGKRYILSIPLLPKIKGGDEKTKFVLTVTQQEEALNKLPESRRDLYRLMMNLGARVSEVLTLQVRDVNLDRGVVTIQRTWSGREIKESTKTNHPRTLPLTDAAIEILKRNMGSKVGSAFVFSNADGSPYTYDQIIHEWKTSSGFDVPLKDGTRRSWATRMRNNGVPIEVVSAGLGHKSIAITQKYLDEDVEWAREIFNKAEIVQLDKTRNERETKKGSKTIDIT
ncbi:MAG: tyrosine-type recombinase/integrase [Syntrophorhabdales bacterium]|jgi:integrase